MKTRVVLIGCRNEAKHLIRSLLSKGCHVTAINEDRSECESLAGIRGLHVYEGDGSRPVVLQDANVNEADIAIAMTTRDDANLVICELCKKKFHVRKTVALIADSKKTEFFRQMGVDSVVCPITTLSSIIEQHALLNDLDAVIPLGETGVQVAQIEIPENAPSVGQSLQEISIPGDVIIGCIMRGNQSVIPRGDTRIMADDKLVLIVSDQEKEAALRKLIG